MGIELKVAANGRVVIPLDVRRALGLEDGGSLWLEQTDSELVLRTRLQQMRAARALAREMLKDYKGDLVAELIADRRREAEMEQAELQDRR